MSPILRAGPILRALHGINKKYQKMYCYPSQKGLLGLLETWQGLSLSIATLNRWLRVVEDNEYLKRTRRIKRDPVKGILFKSTLYHITLKGYMELAKMGVNVWSEIKGIKSQGLRLAAGVVKKIRGAKKLGEILEGMVFMGGSQKTALIK